MELVSIALLTLVAAAIGTITGFGTSTIMIPVLVVFFLPVEAIFLVAIIHWFGNIWKIVQLVSSLTSQVVRHCLIPLELTSAKAGFFI